MTRGCVKDGSVVVHLIASLGTLKCDSLGQDACKVTRHWPVIFVFLLLQACGSFEQSKKDSRVCWETEDAYSAIDRCTRAIQSGRLSNERLTRAFYERAQAHVLRGNSDLAIHDFSAAIKLNPQFVSAFSERGWVYYVLNDSHRALQDLNEAIQLNPKDAYLFDFRAVIYGSMGDHERAMQNLREAKRLNPVLMAVKREVCGEDLCDSFLSESKRESFKRYQFAFFVVGGTGYGTVAAVLLEHGGSESVLKVFKGLGANGEVLQVTPRVLDGKDYIEVYETTSKGNGAIELFELDGTKVSLMFEGRGVDKHDDGSVYEGGILHASYPDINRDGHFDIVLDGVVVSSRENPSGGIMKNPCRRIFLWSDNPRRFQETANGAVNPRLCADTQ